MSSTEFVNGAAGFVVDGDVTPTADMAAKEGFDPRDLRDPDFEVDLPFTPVLLEADVMKPGATIAGLVASEIISPEQAEDLGMAVVAYQVDTEEMSESKRPRIHQKTSELHRAKASRALKFGNAVVRDLFLLDPTNDDDKDRLVQIRHWLRNIKQSDRDDQDKETLF